MMLKKILTALFLLSWITLPAQSHGDHAKIHIASSNIYQDYSSSRSARLNEPVKPIPTRVELDPAKVELGRRLFEEKRLSQDGSMACRNCHLPEKGGADGKRFSPSIDGGHRDRNTPSIFNVGLMTLYGWLGMPNTLETLTEAIIKSKKGLASSWDIIIPRLVKEPEYLNSFNAIYSDGVQPNNVKDAMAVYQRSLITPNSRFDHYLRGDQNAISQEERKGYDLFKEYGCTSCHQGVALGGNMVAPFNLFKNYLDKRKGAQKLDLGRFKKTKDESDKYVFLVPSLRNVALTAPYFHDGSTDELDDAVDIMGRYMLGRVIHADDRKLIVKFLHTLTGEYQGKPL